MENANDIKYSRKHVPMDLMVFCRSTFSFSLIGLLPWIKLFVEIVANPAIHSNLKSLRGKLGDTVGFGVDVYLNLVVPLVNRSSAQPHSYKIHVQKVDIDVKKKLLIKYYHTVSSTYCESNIIEIKIIFHQVYMLELITENLSSIKLNHLIYVNTIIEL